MSVTETIVLVAVGCGMMLGLPLYLGVRYARLATKGRVA